MSTMRRRRRRAPGESEEVDGDGSERGKQERLALEDGHGDGDQENQRPQGPPRTLAPATTPLFSPAQLEDLHAVQAQAPHLHGSTNSKWQTGETSEKVVGDEVSRPDFLPPDQPEQKELVISATTGTPSPAPQRDGVRRQVMEQNTRSQQHTHHGRMVCVKG